MPSCTRVQVSIVYTHIFLKASIHAAVGAEQRLKLPTAQGMLWQGPAPNVTRCAPMPKAEIQTAGVSEKNQTILTSFSVVMITAINATTWKVK